jgi:hypothetical protein
MENGKHRVEIYKEEIRFYVILNDKQYKNFVRLIQVDKLSKMEAYMKVK